MRLYVEHVSGVKTSDGCRLEDRVCNNTLHAKPHPAATEHGATVKKKVH